jgi:IS605 OrfB family transposase
MGSSENLTIANVRSKIPDMQLVAQVKLLANAEQATLLLATLRACNAACNWIAAEAWETQTFRPYDLHKQVYREAREVFGLAAQMAVRAIGKVADAYKTGAEAPRRFHALGAFPFDERLLTWHLEDGVVYIRTLAGRQAMAFACSARERELLSGPHGQADLCLVDGVWYLNVACEVGAPEPAPVEQFLGVDLGIVNIATDSDGEAHSGAQVNGLRHRHRRLRRRLQAKTTRASRRLLSRRRRKERRFARDVNHRIAKQLVAKAERTGRGIALEALQGIRDRVRVRKPQRATLSSWAFAQLGAFVAYKAALAGVLCVWVDPRNTSRECPACGCIDARNRAERARFACIACGFAGPADAIAAGNIARRAAVNRPNVRAGAADFQSAAPVPGTSYRLLAGSC